ncbi:MAG: RHS repeat-associated core domain-containing protein, partial [Acidobacteria bacterium]|nr:RHS repeat-associated core domain-containing protein [Acidobacteriota bacterium]
QPGTTCSVPTNFRFAGMEWDSETGLYHTWFRQYDVNQGRWMGVDPLAGAADNPHSLNRYGYVLEDPVNNFDPLGLHSCPQGCQHAMVPRGGCTADDDCPPEHACLCSSGQDAGGSGRSECTTASGLRVDPSFCIGALINGNEGKDGGTESQPQQQKPPCIPRNQLPFGADSLLTALSFWAKVTGVTYFAGGSVNRTFARGLGATAGGSVLFAADPQGNQAVVTSLSLQGAVGSQAFSAGFVVGAATYQNVSGFGGPSRGGDVQYGRGLAIGGSASRNSSGELTSAFVGGGIGGRATGGPALSMGFQVAPVCAQ